MNTVNFKYKCTQIKCSPILVIIMSMMKGFYSNYSKSSLDIYLIYGINSFSKLLASNPVHIKFTIAWHTLNRKSHTDYEGDTEFDTTFTERYFCENANPTITEKLTGCPPPDIFELSG